MTTQIELIPLQESLAAAIPPVAGGAAWNGGAAKWDKYLREHLAGQRYTLVARQEGEPVGYGSLIFQSHYQPFRAAGIPEISDLVVAEAWRGQGIATTLIAALEAEAASRGCRQIGLGVGLYADYGAAQRLYNHLGYRLDGNGVTANYKSVTPGAMVRVDDDLVIWLVKGLGVVANNHPSSVIKSNCIRPSPQHLSYQLPWVRI